MAGLLDFLKPQTGSLGTVADPYAQFRANPDMLRQHLADTLKRQGRADINLQQLTPDQMLFMLQQLKPVDTIGVRG
jgi:hypothetical protein